MRHRARASRHRVRAPVLVIADQRLAAPAARRHACGVAGRLAPARDPDLAGVLSTARATRVVLARPGRCCAAPTRCGPRSATSVAQPRRRDRGRWSRRWSTATTPACPTELTEAFRTTGLTHLLAVSGTNLTLVVGACCCSPAGPACGRGGWCVVGVLGVRRLRAAGARRAERAAGGGDGHGRPWSGWAATGAARAPARSAPRCCCCCCSTRGWRCRPGSPCRRWRPPGSSGWRRAGATGCAAGCRAGRPRRSRCRSPPSWPARRWWPRSPARSAWSRSSPTCAAAPAVAPATVLGLAGRRRRAWSRAPLGRLVAAPAAWCAAVDHRGGAPGGRAAGRRGRLVGRPRGSLVLTLLCVVAGAVPRRAAGPSRRRAVALGVRAGGRRCWCRCPRPGWPPRGLGAGRLRRRAGRRAGAQRRRRPGGRRRHRPRPGA